MAIAAVGIFIRPWHRRPCPASDDARARGEFGERAAAGFLRERGYRIRLLSAAFRNHMHWSEFIGGDVVISPPYSWQVRFNASDVEVKARIDEPVQTAVIESLLRHFPDFRRAYKEGGLTSQEFDTFGPTVRTLRQFITACHDLDGLVRDFMLPNPDVK